MSREQTMPQAATSTADGLTFQQKSNILTLIITSVVLLFYIARMVPLRPAMVQDPTMPAGFGGLVVSTVIVFVIVEAVLQAVLAFGASGTQTPSAETAPTSLSAIRNAGIVLMMACIGGIASTFLLTPFATVNVLVLGIGSAEIVKSVSHLIAARR